MLFYSDTDDSPRTRECVVSLERLKRLVLKKNVYGPVDVWSVLFMFDNESLSVV